MIDAVIRTAIIERLLDAFHEATRSPDVTVLDALLAAHLFLMRVEERLTPDQRSWYRQDKRSFHGMYDGAPEAFS